jgi:serine/threonine-protein kinase RsbT
MSVEEMSLKSEKNNSKLAGKLFSLDSDKDLVTIREFGRKLASELGFDGKDQTLIATALSEISRNVIEYAGSGEVLIEPGNSVETCIRITVSDNGPGIEDIDKALQEGYSTGQGLGVGLPGAKRIMDEFEIKTNREHGTTIKMCKWLDNHYQF